MAININVLIILMAIMIGLGAVGILYSIIMFKGNKKEAELQLTTKNVLEQVKILYEKSEYALVQLLASKYLDRVPSHIEVRKYLAQAYYKDKKYNNAIKHCLIILKKDSHNYEIKKVLADCYNEKKIYGKAIKEYEEIFDKKSQDTDVIRKLAELYRATDQIFSSISAYNVLSGLLTNDNEIAETQMIIAELSEEAHDYPTAFEAYKNLLEIFPTDTITNKKLTELYIKIKNPAKAIETVQFMLTFVTDPKILQWCFETLVDLYVQNEEYHKAIEYSEKLLELQTTDKFKIRNDIAQYNIKIGNKEVGISILEELVMLSGNGYDVSIELAKAYIECQEYEKALECYTVLLDKSGQKEAKNIRVLISDLYINWAIYYTEMNKIDDSDECLNKAREYNMINPEIYYQYAVNQTIIKNYVTVIEYINRAMEYDKQNQFTAKYLLILSDAHHQLGNFFEEKKALADMLKIDEKNPVGLLRVGVMYLTQHDSKNAEESFKKAIEYDPELLEAKYNLALIYENNNKERAKELYLEVLEQDPTYEEARNALNNLSTSEL